MKINQITARYYITLKKSISLIEISNKLALIRLYRVKILILSDFYLPGYKAGGPIRTLANLVDHLGDEFSFNVITKDRDFKDIKPYPSITVDKWNKLGKARILYCSPGNTGLSKMRYIICNTPHDLLYLNSFFSPIFTIQPLLLRRLGLITRKPIVIAPRGEFSPGALKLKSFKKHFYLAMAKVLRLYHGVIWQASNKNEEANIRRWFGDRVLVIIAPNLPQQIYVANYKSAHRKKTKGHLKVIFLSRISRKKNLDGALRMLKDLKGRFKFNIYGPLEDKHYWEECRNIMSSLPRNIECQYRGVVQHNQVISVMMENDLFFLPTLGENFGHVVLEAFIASCPVLLSDQTPWRGLEKKGIGWDLPLDQPKSFQTVLKKCLEMDQDEYSEWSKRARRYGLKISQNYKTREENRQLFYKARGTVE